MRPCRMLMHISHIGGVPILQINVNYHKVAGDTVETRIATAHSISFLVKNPDGIGRDLVGVLAASKNYGKLPFEGVSTAP